MRAFIFRFLKQSALLEGLNKNFLMFYVWILSSTNKWISKKTYLMQYFNCNCYFTLATLHICIQSKIYLFCLLVWWYQNDCIFFDWNKPKFSKIFPIYPTARREEIRDVVWGVELERSWKGGIHPGKFQAFVCFVQWKRKERVERQQVCFYQLL